MFSGGWRCAKLTRDCTKKRWLGWSIQSVYHYDSSGKSYAFKKTSSMSFQSGRGVAHPVAKRYLRET